MKPQSPTVKKKFNFLELYAGFKGLSKAVLEVNGDQVHVLKPLELYDGWDILTPEGLNEARTLAKEADRIHVAIPCRSYTRARRSDVHGTVPTVRSEARPEGWGHPVAEEGNRHLAAMEVVLLEAAKAGATVSVENPWDSYLWETEKMKRLAKRLNLESVYIDQCAYGGMSKKPTRILTNANWMQAVNLTCNQVRQHKHSKLEGKVWDLWKTSKAAEYAWAQALRDHLQHGPGQPTMQKKTFEKVGLHKQVLVRSDLKRPTSTRSAGSKGPEESEPSEVKLLTFEAENSRAIGDLRDPRASVSQTSHLRTTGLRLRRVLNAALTPETLQAFQICPTETPFSLEVMARTRDALATEFNTTATHAQRLRKEHHSSGARTVT